MTLARELGVENLALAYFHAADGVYFKGAIAGKIQPEDCFQNSQAIMAWFSHSLRAEKTSINNDSPLVKWDGSERHMTILRRRNGNILTISNHHFYAFGDWIPADKKKGDQTLEMQMHREVPSILLHKFIQIDGEWRPKPECFVPMDDIMNGRGKAPIAEVFVTTHPYGWGILEHSNYTPYDQSSDTLDRIIHLCGDGVFWAPSGDKLRVIRQSECLDDTCMCHHLRLGAGEYRLKKLDGTEELTERARREWYLSLVEKFDWKYISPNWCSEAAYRIAKPNPKTILAQTLQEAAELGMA